MAIYFAFKGVYWLMMPFCVPPVVLGLGFLMRCFFKQEILKSNFIYPFILAGLIAAAIYLRVFLFDVFLIPSNSMRDTLYPGDKVLVEKWSMGPKMPDSPLEVPWLNLVYYIGHKMGIETRIPQWSQKRLKGLGGVCHNDVLVYFAEDDESTQAYIKRCIALPGDTLQIVNSRVMINGRELFQPSRLRHYYSMRYTDSQNALTELKTIDVSIETSCYDKQMIFAYLNLEQKDYLLNSKYFESIDF
ncbi:MAG: signal peptidase I, partial [Bacteroidota bacterium]